MVFRYQQTTVNSIDIVSYLVGWKVTRDFNDRISKAVITLTTRVSAVLTVDNTLVNKSVVITRGVSGAGERTEFRGQVESYERKGGLYVLTCLDRMKLAKDVKVTKSYDKNIDPSAGVGSEIYEDLINNFTGLVISATGLVPTSTILIDQFVCKDATVFERGESLCKIYDYQQYFDPTINEVRFEPKGYSVEPVTFSVGSNILNQPRWMIDGEGIINTLTVYGAAQEVETTEFFDGDTFTVSFSLTKTPVSVKVYISSVLKVGGVPNSTTSYDYYVDYVNRKIVFTSPPASGTGNVEVRYSYYLPTPTVVKDDVSVNDYRVREGVMLVADIRTVNDTETFATQRLAQMKDPYRKTTLMIEDTSSNLQVGRLIRVVDEREDIDGDFLVLSHELFYPFRPDRLEVGDQTWRVSNWGLWTSDRLKRIEQELFYNNDTLRISFSFTRDIPFRRRYFKRSTIDISPDGAWDVGFGDNSTGSSYPMNWDDANARWSDGSYNNSEVVLEIIPGGLSYDEFFYDEDFKGTTTGTWSSTGYLQLANTQYATSTTFGYGFTVSSARLNCDLGIIFDGPGYTTNPLSYTGLLFELSANGGSNWQTFTPGVAASFSTSGTDLRWRVTCSKASGVRIIPSRTTNNSLQVLVNV